MKKKQFADELKGNGYRILKGSALKNIKLLYVVDIIDPKAPALGVFNFRAILNIAMLVTESEPAKAIRSRMLDIVLDVVAQKAGGHTKYINQRDADYLPSAYQGYSYRKAFTSVLSQYLDMGSYKYSVYTNKIYQLIFKDGELDEESTCKESLQVQVEGKREVELPLPPLSPYKTNSPTASHSSKNKNNKPKHPCKSPKICLTAYCNVRLKVNSRHDVLFKSKKISYTCIIDGILLIYAIKW